MSARPFIKMHGLGNDFVVLDGRTTRITVDAKLVQAISNRRTGVGCDQVILLESSDRADLFMRIYNSDGSEVEACGNAARCVAQLITQETGAENILLETTADILRATASSASRPGSSSCCTVPTEEAGQAEAREPALESVIWASISLCRGHRYQRRHVDAYIILATLKQ